MSLLTCGVYYINLYAYGWFGFTFEIHHGGTFVWDPDLIYLGGSVSTIDNINPNRLSFFEIQGMCVGFGVTSKVDFITLFLEVIWRRIETNNWRW